MNLNDIKRLSGMKQVPVGIIEKDYVLSLTLLMLSKSRMIDHLIFKGGTAIKKMYFPDARFSVDLDFDFDDITLENIKKEVDELIPFDEFDTVAFVKIKEAFESKKEDVYRCMIEYQGPLKHNLNQAVRLDFNKQEAPLTSVQERHIRDEYKNETAGVTIKTMSISEMFAEKCRAFITRKEQKSKDLFDIHFLIYKGVLIKKNLIEKKFIGYKESFTLDLFTRIVQEIAGVWKRDLQDLLPRGSIPEINDVESEVRKKLFS